MPEIELTAQIINRLSKYFGKRVGVYHSRYNQNEQVEIWNKVLEKDYKKCITQFRELGVYNSARLIIDVDPY